MWPSVYIVPRYSLPVRSPDDITAARDERLLTFGAGPHFCLGTNLTRAELQEALAFLAPRMPGLTSAGPADLGAVEGIYGIESLSLR
jgi:cytochrome P450